MYERGHIYSGKYSGWYCVSDETFLSNDEITEKKNKKGELVKISLESGHPVEWYEEENFKFRLSAFQDDVRHWLKNGIYTVKYLLVKNNFFFFITISFFV